MTTMLYYIAFVLNNLPGFGKHYLRTKILEV